MTRNKILFLAVIIISAALTSCATNKAAKRNIVGHWQPYKVGTVELRKLQPSDDTVAHQYSQDDYTMLNDLKRSLGKPASGEAAKGSSSDFENLIVEASTAYIFSVEGYAGRDNATRPMRGNWKMNRKGTEVTITDAGSLESFSLSIDTLTSSKMIATNPNLKGIKVSYYKNQ